MKLIKITRKKGSRGEPRCDATIRERETEKERGSIISSENPLTVCTEAAVKQIVLIKSNLVTYSRENVKENRCFVFSQWEKLVIQHSIIFAAISNGTSSVSRVYFCNKIKYEVELHISRTKKNIYEIFFINMKLKLENYS